MDIGDFMWIVLALILGSVVVICWCLADRRERRQAYEEFRMKEAQPFPQKPTLFQAPPGRTIRPNSPAKRRHNLAVVPKDNPVFVDEDNVEPSSDH